MGQDGAYLANFLLKKKYEVFGTFRRNSNYENFRLNYLNIKEKIKLIDMELTEFSSVNYTINKIKPDEIYNLAAMSFVESSFYQPIFTMNTNALGVLNILETLRSMKKKIKLYQASTSEMFGNSTGKKINENTLFQPASPYAVSKVTAHNLICFYREAYKMFCCSGILFNHESPLRGKEFVTKKIIEKLCEYKIKKKGILELGNLYAKRDWGYAKEYVEVMWKMLQAKKAQDYVIGTGKSYSIKDFINLVCNYLNIKIKWLGSGINEKCIDKKNNKIIIKINNKFYRPLDVNILKANASKARKFLKWKPNTDIKKLVKIMCDFELKKS